MAYIKGKKIMFSASVTTGSDAIIECQSLPTNDISLTHFYKTADGVYWYDGEWHKLGDGAAPTSVSFHDLKDKPFYDDAIYITHSYPEGATVPLTQGDAYFQTEKTYTLSQLLGATGVYQWGSGWRESFTVSASHVVENTSDGLTLKIPTPDYDVYIFVAYTTKYKPSVASTAFPTVGTYFSFYDDGDAYSVVTLRKDVAAKTLDNKFIDLPNNEDFKALKEEVDKCTESISSNGVVQSDYNENDSTKDSYIKNRPFYEIGNESATYTVGSYRTDIGEYITFAGLATTDTISRDEFSDCYMTVELINADSGSTVIETLTVTPDELSEEVDSANGVVTGYKFTTNIRRSGHKETYLFIIYDYISYNTNRGTSFPSNGIYLVEACVDLSYADTFLQYSNFTIMRSITLMSSVQRKTLDAKFIPASIARVKDIPTVPKKASELENDTGYLTSYTESDPTVPDWAKQPTKPSYTAKEVGALPDTTVIPTVPTKVSELENDRSFVTNLQLEAKGYATVEAVTSKVAEIVADAPEDFDTLKEMSTWIASHEGSAAEMNSAIKQNTDDIKELRNAGYLTEIPEQYVTDTELNEALGSIPSEAIIDVDTLPTENINENAFYRVGASAYTLYNGVKGEQGGVPTRVIVVDTLPETGEPYVNSDMSIQTMYLRTSDSTIHAYVDETLSEMMGGMAVGWLDLESTGTPYFVVTSPVETPEGNILYIIYNEGGLFTYNNGEWVEISTGAPESSIVLDYENATADEIVECAKAYRQGTPVYIRIYDGGVPINLLVNQAYYLQQGEYYTAFVSWGNVNLQGGQILLGSVTIECVNGKITKENDTHSLHDTGSSSEAIIDVDSLPTENINGNAFYRVKTPNITNVYSYSYEEDTQTWETGTIYGNPVNVRIVDTLPEIGEAYMNFPTPTRIVVYFQTSDSKLYMYIDEAVHSAMSYPLGWNSSTDIGAKWEVVNSVDEATDTTKVYFIKTVNGYKYRLYTYTNGEWIEYVTKTQLDEAMNGSAYIMVNGAKNDIYGTPVEVITVENLPLVGTPAMSENADKMVCYFQKSDVNLYFYIDEATSTEMGLDVGWIPASAMGTPVTVVETPVKATDPSTIYVVYDKLPLGAKLYKHIYSLSCSVSSSEFTGVTSRTYNNISLTIIYAFYRKDATQVDSTYMFNNGGLVPIATQLCELKVSTGDNTSSNEAGVIVMTAVTNTGNLQVRFVADNKLETVAIPLTKFTTNYIVSEEE